MIIFSSDNGGLGLRDADSIHYEHMSSGRLRGEKGTLYEGGECERACLLVQYILEYYFG